jgi:hypothetical protein
MNRIPPTCLLLLVTGCASNTSALIDEAMETGDWSAVNVRLEAEAQRAERQGSMCPNGSTAVCVSDFGVTDCRCVNSAVFHYELGGIAR